MNPVENPGRDLAQRLRDMADRWDEPGPLMYTGGQDNELVQLLHEAAEFVEKRRGQCLPKGGCCPFGISGAFRDAPHQRRGRGDAA
jgi:hypothetical protein